jgi:hypothetical protein
MTKMCGWSDYSVFGLRVRSQLSLPELFAVDGEGIADVTIRVGPIDETQQEEGLHSVDGALLFVAPDAGRYRIANGSEILVECRAGAPARNVRIYLLGSAFGALLHQRGLLPLHANAVQIERKAVAFMGASGEGKSTLAAWFHDRGYRIIADDVCVVGFDEAGQAYAAPGLPRLRLWSEALEFTGRQSAGLERSYVGAHDSFDKFDIPVQPAAAARSDVPLAAIYVLDRAERFSIAELRGIEAADAVYANTYRGSYVLAASTHQGHWQSALGLVRNTPVFGVSRQWDLTKLDEQGRMLVEHAVHVIKSKAYDPA